MTDGLFTADDLVHAYTRQQAIEDGVLIDVSTMAQEAGLKWPTALTAALWSIIEDAPTGQDPEGRLWDVLYMGRLAVGKQGSHVVSWSPTEVHYHVILSATGDPQRLRTVKIVSGPGDDLEPVLTFMLPYED